MKMSYDDFVELKKKNHSLWQQAKRALRTISVKNQLAQWIISTLWFKHLNNEAQKLSRDFLHQNDGKEGKNP